MNSSPRCHKSKIKMQSARVAHRRRELGLGDSAPRECASPQTQKLRRAVILCVWYQRIHVSPTKGREACLLAAER